MIRMRALPPDITVAPERSRYAVRDYGDDVRFGGDIDHRWKLNLAGDGQARANPRVGGRSDALGPDPEVRCSLADVMKGVERGRRQ